jgi:hypothetical protein
LKKRWRQNHKFIIALLFAFEPDFFYVPAMSGNRRTPMPLKQAADTEQPLSSRMVAIPKEPPADKAPPIKPVERIGDSLRAARLNRREDLYPIAEYLRIKPAFLVALENSQYDAFPADAYVIGFLRT